MDKEKLKQKVCATIDSNVAKIAAYAEDVAKEPELGFKEIKTAAKMAAVFDELGIEYRAGLAITGVKGRVHGGKKGPTIAVIGELDAIGCADSLLANPLTGAAHACGHNIQQAAMIGAAYGLVKSGVLADLAGDVVFFGVPAEEYVELDYRKHLRAEGKLHFLHGKGELIYLGEFDDIDMAMQIHSDKNMPKPTVSIGQSSNGFVGKTVQYIGKTAHAADAPDQGINALNAAMLGLMGINALRETFREKDVIRVHPIITKGGDLVNSVPSDVRVETYVRAKTMEAMEATNIKIDAALRAGGAAIGAKVIIDTLPGQLPLICNNTLNNLFVDNAKIANPKVEIKDSGHFSASTDMGDVSHLMPVIHPFIGGTTGLLHTKDFCVVDFDAAAILPAKTFAMMIIDLLADDGMQAKAILAEHKPVLSKEEYVKKLDGYFSK
ncbi:N-acetyldiaminopimelate deacetylase [bioreactor metagenome]|uniref:N-acetyldiaminopimelate deacetylase n=1 Tax=bioreactor metagenome TaxID=1076179 RepID=A0A644UJ68_9ZZZZ|nr:amidohydrolase [Acidaminococcaceae bacterium]